MKDTKILRDLFDEKILKIISLLIKNPSKDFSLSEISIKSKVNITTTFRIMKKLVEKEFVKINTIGKTKNYQIKPGEKAETLNKFLK